jgi:hypothetical protein
MTFLSPMTARMTVGRVANEVVTTKRAILLRKEIVIHFGPALTVEIKTGDGPRELGEFKSWRAVRVDRRLATTGARNRDPDTRPSACQTCFPLPKYLPRSSGRPPSRAFALRNVSRSYCSTRKICYRTRCRDRMSRHRHSRIWARISASFAASTGSRDRAEQRHALSQEEAAASPSTAAISGSSPEFVGSIGSLTLRHFRYSNQCQLLASFRA